MDNKPERDSLQRPSRTGNAGSLPLASDILVASAARRLLAFMIDMAIITALVWYAFPKAATFFSLSPHQPMPSLPLWFFLTWGTYVALWNASSLRATPGQGLMRIYVADIFGGTLSPVAAIGRFIVFSTPTLIMLIFGSGEILHVIPGNFSTDSSLDMSYSSLSELFYIVPVLLQFLMVWPMLNGNYNRVLWDRLFHSCVLRCTPRSLK